MPIEDGQRSKLSVHSSGLDKFNEKVNISIKKFKNLVVQKAEGITLYAKIEFNENTIAESQKIQCMPDNIPDLNFVTSLSVITNDQTSLDEILYKPIIVTLIEVLPKEKKQKEEKIQPFGQSAFDLIKIYQGETNVSLKLPVYPVPGSTLESQPSDMPLPELEAKLSVDQPLLSDEEAGKCNMVTITLESMYAIPESWYNNAKECAYSVSVPIPLGEDKENPAVFVNGVQKMPTDPTSRQKRWTDTRGIQAANALFIPQSLIPDDTNSEELGDFQLKEDKEYRVSSEKEKPRVTWNAERRCFLNSSAYAAFRDQVLKTRFWPIEVIKTAVPTGVKGKKDEDLGMSYHGVAYVDMAHLLYPGATQIKGAYRVHPYADSDYATKTKRKMGIVDETLRVVSYLYDRNFAILPAKKDQKGVEKKDVKKPPRESNSDGHDLSQSVQQMMDAKSFIVIEIKFDKPLIPRKPFDVLVKKVSEMIPPRPKYPIRTNSAEKAVKDFNVQIKAIVNSVLDEYRSLLPDDSEFLSSEIDYTRKESEYERRRRKLLFELNSTGKYFAFKEQLKNSVIRIVREKFLRTSALNHPEELQQFLSELYVFLTDELHKSLNDILAYDEQPSIENNFTDSQQMKHFALEAEMNRNFDLAAYYYQERIAREKDNYTNWLDYATFNLLIENYARCEECLKECISINQNEISGVICSMQEKYELAETFLERVCVQDSENVVAWTLYAVLHEQKGEELNAEITFKKAMKINQAQINELLSLNTNHSANNQSESVDDESKKDEDVTTEDTMTKAQQTEAMSKSRNSKRGTIKLENKIKLDLNSKSPKSPGFSMRTGDDQLVSGKEKLNVESSSLNKSIFMKTAKFLIKYNAFSWAEKCMAKELVNPSGGPGCLYHTLLARIKLARNQLDEAEKHCNEALSFDYQSSDAWIIWSHVSYLSDNFKDARERYERVLQFNDIPHDQTHSIYIRLASIYLKMENFEDAKRLFLYPCKYTPSCMSWLGVGICCYRLEQLEEAKNALCEANILNNKAPEVWAYLTLICLKTNRPLEAEQAYKYAIKLNLDNPEILEEIHNLQEKVGFGNPQF